MFLWLKNTKKFNSLAKIKRAWQSEFKNIPAPSNGTILYNACKFEKTGSVNRALPKRLKASIKRLQLKIG